MIPGWIFGRATEESLAANSEDVRRPFSETTNGLQESDCCRSGRPHVGWRALAPLRVLLLETVATTAILRPRLCFVLGAAIAVGLAGASLHSGQVHHGTVRIGCGEASGKRLMSLLAETNCG